MTKQILDQKFVCCNVEEVVGVDGSCVVSVSLSSVGREGGWRGGEGGGGGGGNENERIGGSGIRATNPGNLKLFL